MSEKLDELERALIGSTMGLTFRECQSLIKYARALESRVELGSMLLREQIDKTCAANLRVLELENAGAEIGRKKGEGNG